jgi:glycosyltransferase involved in cell wall biosynthesis
MMALHVLNVFFSKSLGGVEQAYLDYTQALVDQGHRVTCIVHPRCRFMAPLAATQADICALHNRGHYDLLSAFRLRRLAGELQPDIALGHNGRAYNLLKLALRGRLPLVGVKHNDDTKRLAGLDYVLCVNSHVRGMLLEQGLDPARVAVMPNMIDIDPHAAPPMHSLHRPQVIGALGRLCRQKGFDVLLQALDMLRRRHPELPWRLRLAGSGEAEAQLHAQVAALGLAERVEFAGWIDDKQAFFDSIDVFALPSRDEPFGIVLLEAFKHGVPVVATRCHGPVDIITDGDNGFLVARDNPEVLAQGLYSLLTDPVRAQAVAARAYIMARAQYSRAVVGVRLATLLSRYVAESRARARA